MVRKSTKLHPRFKGTMYCGMSLPGAPKYTTHTGRWSVDDEWEKFGKWNAEWITGLKEVVVVSYLGFTEEENLVEEEDISKNRNQ